MNAEEVAVMTDVPNEVQRWTAKRKAAVVTTIVKGETSAAEAARKHVMTLVAATESGMLCSQPPAEPLLTPRCLRR